MNNINLPIGRFFLWQIPLQRLLNIGVTFPHLGSGYTFQSFWRRLRRRQKNDFRYHRYCEFSA